MARFKFRVSDAEGRLRKGTMEAETLAEARAIATERGFTIIELSEAGPGEPSIKLDARPASARYHPGPAPRREYRPTWAQRLDSLLQPTLLRGSMTVLVLAGGLWMAFGWESRVPVANSPVASRNAPARPQAFKLSVEGMVTVDGGLALGDVQLTLDLPEVPYQQNFDWTKVKHTTPRNFSAEIQFESTRRARQLIVRARKPGFGEASSDVLRLQPGGGKVSGVRLHIKAKKK